MYFSEEMVVVMILFAVAVSDKVYSPAASCSHVSAAVPEMPESVSSPFLRTRLSASVVTDRSATVSRAKRYVMTSFSAIPKNLLSWNSMTPSSEAPASISLLSSIPGRMNPLMFVRIGPLNVSDELLAVYGPSLTT